MKTDYWYLTPTIISSRRGNFNDEKPKTSATTLPPSPENAGCSVETLSHSKDLSEAFLC